MGASLSRTLSMSSLRLLALLLVSAPMAWCFMAPAPFTRVTLRAPAIAKSGLRAPMMMSGGDDGLDTKKLFIGGIPWAFDSEDLKEAFSEFGAVADANIVYDRETGRSRGFGFVTFEDEEAAKKACEEMNEAEVGGRTV